MTGRLFLAGLALALTGAGAPPRPIPSARLVEMSGRVTAAGVVVADATAPCPAARPAADADPCVAVRVEAAGRPPFVLTGTAGPHARIGIGPLERGRPAAVLLVTFTGGAHCCERYDVALPAPGGWRRLTVARREVTDTGPQRQTEFDYGLRSFPADVDGDGRADFVLGDDAFAYAFADYADSWSPPVILDIAGDRFADVSRRPGFRPLFEVDMAKARRACVAPDPQRSPNGACAAYAADAARLGRLDGAWPEVLAHYDHAQDAEGLTRCTAAYAGGHCPAGHEVRYPDYPAALRDFLRRTGYLEP